MVRTIAVLTLGFGSAVASSARGEDEVRIQLLRRPTVEVRGKNLSVYDGDRGHQLVTLAGPQTATLAANGQGLVVIRAAGAGTETTTVSSQVLVEAQHAIEVEEGAYYGRLEVRLEKPSALRVVNRLPLETYLLGVLGSEMSAQWPLEALRAQAVASRTYALQRIKEARAADRPFDLTDSVLSQVYHGASDISDPVRRAVISTRGEVLAFDRRLAEALFHSTCGGRTASAQEHFGGARPYLVERPCSWCRSSRYYRWETSVPLDRLTSLLKPSGRLTGELRAIAYRPGDQFVRFTDRKGPSRLPLRAFRGPLSWKVLPSDVFRAVTRRDRVHFQGRGFGHRVGMCQWGARGMAAKGRTYLTILQHYYPGTYVQRIY